ncbi:MAG: hypothetical protein PHT48_09570 [Dechloromonas sp.]|nr:hypothetical protein [Dechloromonas sp.]
MAVYYYDAQATGANDGSTKDDAFTTFAAAVAAANVDGDIIYHHAASQENLAADTTYNFQASVSIFCIDFTTDIITDPHDVGGYIGSNVSNRSVILASTTAGLTVFMSHFSWSIAGSNNRHLELNQSKAGLNLIVDVVTVDLKNNTGQNSSITIGATSTSAIFAEAAVTIRKLRTRFGVTTHRINIRGAKATISGFEIVGDSTLPEVLFYGTNPGSVVDLNNCDLSNLASGTIIVGNCVGSPANFTFSNCKLPTGYILLDAQASGVPSAGEVWAYDCYVGTTHIPFEYSNAFGNIKQDTGKYADDNLSGDRSYLITTTAKVRTDTPFYCPWIEQWHEGTSSISPYFAIASDGSATAFNNDQVWAEFEGKVTAGAHIKTNYSDKMALLGTPAAQTTDTDTSWTGLGGTNWKGKVGEQSLTPAEPGTISGRIVVGSPNASFNWDTRIRF